MNAEIGQGQGYEPGVGALLRASRLRRGEDLRDISAQLRIRYPFLEAIEEGRYQALPGSAYAIGFVRTYAEHLGLDSEEVVRRFKTEAENLERRSDLVFPSPMAERSTPGGAIIFVGILMAAVAYGAWYLGTAKQSFLDDLVSPLPDRLTAMLRGNGDAPTAPPPAIPGETTNGAPMPAPETPAPAAPSSGPQPTKPGSQVGEAVAPPAETAPSTAVSTEPPVGAPSAPPPQPEMASRPAAPTPGPTRPVLAPTPPPAAAPTPPPTAAPTPPPAAASTPPVPAARVAPPTERSEPPAAVTSVPATPSTSQVTTPPPASPVPPAAPPQAAPEAAPAEPPAPPEAATEEPAEQLPDSVAAAPADAAPRIVVRAKLDSWIQVRDGVARRLLVTRLLRAGETYEVPNQPSLSLLTGNAGGLEILVDGEPVPAIGEVGAVRRDVALEADRLKAGTAVVD